MPLHLYIPALYFVCICSLIPYAQSPEPGELTAQLQIRQAGDKSIRITLIPAGMSTYIPFNPVLGEGEYPAPSVSLKKIRRPVSKKIGSLRVEIHPEPLRITITNDLGEPVQEIIFYDNGNVGFRLDGWPVLGMGEGGPKPDGEWRDLPVEFNRVGRFHAMQPRWQGNAYGSRNPVPLLVGTGGWGIFVASPWVQVDLSGEEGLFIPVRAANADSMRQDRQNQQLNLGKGIPPPGSTTEGYLDIMVFDAHDPAAFMRDVAAISGPAVMPPKWALGYMQSHRTLENDAQMIAIVDSFRAKKIPLDAVIYLGTGFCPRGWNTPQPSFDFNPEVFRRDPAAVISDLHDRNVKVILHMVPWDRDRLPTLHGSIPPRENERIDTSHIYEYWKQHEVLVNSGVDAWWPDEGDWFNLFERIKRHQMYYQGPLSSKPDTRPWSLHRNGYLGIARWGGWVWSGDTESSWKTLEAQIAVGINHSLSLSPYWGSDIGGFYPGDELSGELYARWFQFGTFCPSFRSHGRTWWTRLPWGWGLKEMGPLESRRNPLQSELNNPAIEPVCRQYAELRYRLLSYNYSLAWEAKSTGMPLMRAMWLHYPEDRNAAGLGNQYLWGRDILVAAVYVNGATSREVYLPAGDWYDWWSHEKFAGQRTIERKVDLSTMPIFVRAGTILPLDPVRQYSGQETEGPLTLRIFPGADGLFTLYEDDGTSLGYLKGKYSLTHFAWNDGERILSLEPAYPDKPDIPGKTRIFLVEVVCGDRSRKVVFEGKPMQIRL